MGQIEWAMWANEQAVVSGVCLLMGGIIGVAGWFRNWQFSACVLAESVLILILEWPRSKRVKGNTIERKFQRHLTKFVNKLTPVASNYYFRFILYLAFSVPSCFLLPTIMGGLALMIASIIYLVAAIKGEQWKPVGLDPPKAEPAPAAGVPLPGRAPPRRPVQQNADHGETTFDQI